MRSTVAHLVHRPSLSAREMFFGKDQLRDVEDSIVEQTSRAMPKTA
jgi:hypothetical protein